MTRLNAITSQLDRLEGSSQTSEASMSSLASDMSRMLEILSSSPALATPAKSDEGGRQFVETDTNSADPPVVKRKNSLNLSEQRQQPFPVQFQWSCDFLSGIEDAFSASGCICLYCGDEFDNDSTDWSIKGRHLVDEHRYGECNLLISYDSGELFHRHIQEFHECSNYLSNDFLAKHHQYGRERGFHRGLRSKDQHLTDDFHSIRSRRLGALFADNRWFQEMHTQPCGARATSSTKIVESQPSQRPWQLELSAAIRDESCIVDGLLIASPGRLWSISNQCASGIEKPCFSLGDGIRISRYEFDGRHDLACGASSLLHTYDRTKKPALGDGEELGKPLTTSISASKPLGNAEVAKERNRINAWLRDILISSFTIKVIVYHTIGKENTRSLNMDTWLETTLGLWELDEAAKKTDEQDNYSDGALDSRGSAEIRNATDHESAHCEQKICTCEESRRRSLGSRLEHLNHTLDGLCHYLQCVE